MAVIYYESTSIWDVATEQLRKDRENVFKEYKGFVGETGRTHLCNSGEGVQIFTFPFRAFGINIPTGIIEVNQSGCGIITWGEQLVVLNNNIPFFLLTALTPDYPDKTFVGGAVEYVEQEFYRSFLRNLN